MAQLKSFQDLTVWQKAHALVLFIYQISRKLPKEERFILIPQILRATIAVAANIAEGFHRYTANDSLHFYTIAESSLEEVRYYAILIHDLKYIDDSAYKMLDQKIIEVSKMLMAWMRSQRFNIHQ